MVTITEWGFGTDNTLAKARVDAFNRRYASSIKLNVVPQVNAQKILTAVASGNVPDILWLDRASIASWAARGALEPLDDLIGKSRVVRMSQFYPAAVKQVTYSGHVWGVPQFMDVRPLWVNLDPLKQAGLTPAQVQHASWNALRADGIKLTKKRGSKVSRWGFDTKVQDGFFWMYSWGNGGDLLSADGKHASFDDAKNVAALQYVVETVKSQGGLAALKAFAETWGWNAQHPFIQNQVGITLYENWLLGMIAQFAPSHNFAVYPFHGMNGKPVSLTGGLAWAIPKGAANRDAAWTFIEFMTAASTWKIGAQADKAQNGAKGAPFIPYLIANTVVDKMLMTDEYKPISAKFDQVVRLFPYLLQHGRSIPASPVYNQLNDITIIYTALYVPLHMVVALGLALLLNTRVRGIPFWRTFFYLPSITPIVAVAILWRWILNPSGGAINAVLAWIGISGPAWTTDPLWMKPSLVLIALWAVGSTMLIYVAGLKNVPQELYEAAKVDGAGVFRRFFSVTLPVLSSVLFFTAVIGVVNALQIFTQAVVLFQPLGGGGDTASAMSGGTGSAALFYIMYLFSQAFAYFKMGYASALAWILFIIIVAFTISSWPLPSCSSGSPIAGSIMREVRHERATGHIATGDAGSQGTAPARLGSGRHRPLSDAGRAIGLLLIPFFWLVATSLMTPAQIFGANWLPNPIRWSNYSEVFANTDFLLWTRNSFIVTILAVVTVALSSALIAYPFAKLRFPLKNVLFALILATMMLPSAVTMVPTFLIWKQLHLVNTLYPLWAGNLFGSAFYIFMLRQFLLTIPNDLKDAAMVDGASHLRTFWSVMLPLIRPALIAVMLFEFIAKWNDYLTPLIYLNRSSLYTLPLGLATFTQSQGFQTRWDLWMASSVLMTLPILILFFAGQRFFIEGIATTGLKG